MTFLRKYQALILLVGFSPVGLVVAAPEIAPIATGNTNETVQNVTSSTLGAISAKQAEVIYRDNCAICHGDNGDANTRAQSGLRPPPRNFTTASSAIDLSRERMINSVAHGRPGTGMMAHKDRFSEAEIEAVVDYIRDNFMMKAQQSDNSLTTHVKGETTYVKYCSVCHGDKGNTAIWAKSGLNPQPRDFGSAQSKAELTRERMINSVANGRPGTAMMPHSGRLTGQEIVEVVDYIRAAFMQNKAQESVVASGNPVLANPSAVTLPRMPAASVSQQTQGGHPQVPSYSTPQASLPLSGNTGAMAATQADPHRRDPHAGMGNVAMMNMPGMPAAMPPIVDADMTVAMPNGLTGDATRGREFYMKNCFECHGVKGDGNGPRAYFNTPRPRDFTSEASTRMLNRQRIFDAVTNGKVGTVMPAWGKVLTKQQIANVSEFVFEAFISAAGSANVGEEVSTGTDDKKKVN